MRRKVAYVLPQDAIYLHAKLYPNLFSSLGKGNRQTVLPSSYTLLGVGDSIGSRDMKMTEHKFTASKNVVSDNWLQVRKYRQNLECV